MKRGGRAAVSCFGSHMVSRRRRRVKKWFNFHQKCNFCRNYNYELYKTKKTLSSEEIELIFPTLQCLELCGASVVVSRFPTSAELPLLKLECLEANDKYPPSDIEVNVNKVLSFHGGRIALRRALAKVTSMDIPSITRLPSGAPLLPAEVTGSVSHKDNLAVACAMLRGTSSENSISSDIGHLGIDIEHIHLARPSSYINKFAERILTENEKETLGILPAISLGEEVLLRFSLKEAVYKSLEPKFKRYISYKEIEVYPAQDGSAAITKGDDGVSPKFSAIAQWKRFSPHIQANNETVKKDYWISCVYAIGFS